MSTERGYWRDFTSEAHPVPKLPDHPDHAVAFGRAMYSYLTGGWHDWSGVELGVLGDVTSGLGGSFTFHHEYRDVQGEFGVATLAARVSDDYQVVTTVGVGNGAWFLPTTELDYEVRGKLFAPSQHFGVGGGASWWSAERQQQYGSLRYEAWLGHAWSIEARAIVSVLSAQDSDTKVDFMGTATVAKGRLDGVQWLARVGAGDEPRYPAAPDLRYLPDEAVLDVAVSMRQWLTPRYGHMVTLGAAGQYETYRRIGIDYTIFFRLW